MPRYVFLILDDPKREWSPEAGAEMMGRMGRFAGELARRGKLQGGNPLKPMAEAVRVRENGGKLTVTDGPFTETKEMVGGFFVVEAADRAEAIEIAKQCPHTAIGAVEVREVVEVGGPPR